MRIGGVAVEVDAMRVGVAISGGGGGVVSLIDFYLLV